MNFVITDIDQTVQQLLDSKGSNLTPKIFLETKQFEKSPTNWEFIKRRYFDLESDELVDNESKYPSGDILIKSGTQLLIQTFSQNRDSESKPIEDVFSFTQLKPFIAQQLADLLNDPKYVSKIQNFDTGEVIGSLENNTATVYIWCRALNDWIDASKHISQLTTSVTDAGGVFQIVFRDIPCKLDGIDTFTWIPLEGESLSMSNLDKRGDRKRPNFYFDVILSENDLVYIKFEDLADEVRVTETFVKPAGQIWDMIGLIDVANSQVTVNSSITSVQGRDFIKLLIEDGSIFFSSQFLGNIFVNPETLLAKRNQFTGIEQSYIYAFSSFKSVGALLRYVVNKYSNLGIIPNSAFVSYGDSLLLEKYDLNTSSLKSISGGDVFDQLDQRLSDKRQGAWRLIDFVFDDEPSKRLVSDSSFSQDNGSMINSIRKLCQEPFIEFRGDTYKDKYYFTVRKPPFDENGYKGLVYGFVQTELLNEGSVVKENKDDSRLKAKTREKIQRERNEFSLSRQNTLSVYCIDIDDSEVYAQSLSYHKEAYSWYRLIPRGLGTMDESLQFLFTPIVAFDEYAEIFGSRTLSVESNYTPASLLDDLNNDKQIKYIENQAFLDLQFLIQSNAYLPFTRQGTISLVGKRTIKRGMFIYFKPTNEVFYVDAVSHSKSIGNSASENNRTTTIQVSRGMIEPYIKGVYETFNEEQKLVSYFTIVDTKIENKSSIDSANVLKNWKVDKDVFDFFVQKRQWA